MLRDGFFAVFNDFALGTVDIYHSNFEIISLIPKVKGAESIKQYRLIALINVPFKICAKDFTTCMAPVE